MYTRKKTERQKEVRLAVFGLILAGMGWFATGVQLSGLFLGLGMGLGSVLVMGLCLYRIENRSI